MTLLSSEKPMRPAIPDPLDLPLYAETLPCAAESAADARRLVRKALDAWGLQVLEPSASLVVSELVGNSVEHYGRDLIRVKAVRLDEDRVQVAVIDRSPQGPTVPKQAELLDESGRGLFLVDALAADWGTDRMRWGKRVWANLTTDIEETDQ
ncbi:ATP-binding protein [Streptomyces sp. NPDC056549]|uniref:ATP-binding protein n=1 Tax=Streptomyces sp. NPDC056549 TaxID=3345864 RepID=UPI0036B06762